MTLTCLNVIVDKVCVRVYTLSSRLLSSTVDLKVHNVNVESQHRNNLPRFCKNEVLS